MEYYTYALIYAIDTQYRYKIYSWVCKPEDGSRELVYGNNIVYFLRQDGIGELYRTRKILQGGRSN